MGIGTAPGAMTTDEIVALNRAHTFFSWSAQGAIDPIAIDRAEGVWLYTPDGRRILDFNSQLMSVNIGHGDRRVIDAITEQATKLQYVQPAFATEIRGRLGQKLAEILPGDLDKVFFTLGGAEAIENAIKLARHYTGRTKVLARYRAYHGATMGAMTLTGDPRRWANEPGLVGVVRYPDTHRWGEAEPRPVAESLQGLEDVIRYEGPHTIAAVFLETIVGTNGILIPPDGYLAGRPRAVRPPRHPHGLRRGHGRLRADRALVRRRPLGRRARPHDDGQGPDLVVPAARGGGHAPRHRRGVRGPDVLRRPDLLVASGLAGRRPGHDPGLRGGRPASTTRPGWAPGCASTTSAWPPSTRASARIATWACSGSWTSSASRDPWTPMTPFNGTSDEMKAIGKYLRDHGAVHDAGQQLDPHQPAAVHHRGRAGRTASRSSTPRSTSPTSAVAG